MVTLTVSKASSSGIGGFNVLYFVIHLPKYKCQTLHGYFMKSHTVSCIMQKQYFWGWKGWLTSPDSVAHTCTTLWLKFVTKQKHWRELTALKPLNLWLLARLFVTTTKRRNDLFITYLFISYINGKDCRQIQALNWFIDIICIFILPRRQQTTNDNN